MALLLDGIFGRGFAEPWRSSQVAKELLVKPELAQRGLEARLGP